MYVEIRNIRDGEDNLAGRLRLDGDRIVAEPEDDALLQGILSHPAADHAQGRLYDPREEPADFLRALHQQYTSAYLRCSPVIKDDGGKSERVEKAHDGNHEASSLAQFYADSWNHLYGADVPDEELHAASEELSGTHWRVTRRPDGEWRAHHYADKKPLREWSKSWGPEVEKKAEHAPKGGISLLMDGMVKFFVGGQWIPAKDIAKLSPAEKAKLEAAKQAAKMGRVNRGDINPEQLRGQLQPHARELNEQEQQRAGSEFQALHNYHGELTLHRIEQLAKQQQEFLKRANLTDKQKAQITGNLARLHAMLDLAQQKGVTGAVPKEMQQEALAKTAKQPPPTGQPPQETPNNSKGQADNSELTPSKPPHKEAKPDSTGFLSVQALMHDHRFHDKDGEFDASHAFRAVKRAVQQWGERGGKVLMRMRGSHPLEVVSDGKQLRTVDGKPVGLARLLGDEKSGLQFVKKVEQSQAEEQGKSPDFLKPEWLSRTPDQAARLAKDAAIAAGKNPQEVERIGRAAFDYAHQHTTNRNSIYQRELLRGEKAGLSEEQAKDRAAAAVARQEQAAKPAEQPKPEEKPVARTESPMSAEDAAKALAKQAGHIAQPKEGEDAASAFNRQLMEEGKEKPKEEEKPAAKPQPDKYLQHQIYQVEEALKRDPERNGGQPVAPAEPETPATPKMTSEQEDRLRRNKEMAARAEAEHQAKLKETPASAEEQEQRLRQNKEQAQTATTTDDEKAFHAASKEALADDPIAQKLFAKGEGDLAQRRVLTQLLRDGVAIPQHVRERFPEAYEAAQETVAKESKESPEEREQRLREHQALNYGPGREQSKERAEAHQREVWAGKARKEGIEPKYLQAAADKIMATHEERRDAIRRLLKDARNSFQSLGYNAGLLTANMQRGRIEDQIPAIDQVANTMRQQHPDLFEETAWDPENRFGTDYEAGESKQPDRYVPGRGYVGGGIRNAAEQLAEYFADGVPPPLDKDKAYEDALDYLREQKENEAARQEREPGADEDDEEAAGDDSWLEDDEYDPFDSQWKSLRRWLRKNWNEFKHPRGQPENSGEFAPKEKKPDSSVDESESRANNASGGTANKPEEPKMTDNQTGPKIEWKGKQWQPKDIGSFGEIKTWVSSDGEEVLGGRIAYALDTGAAKKLGGEKEPKAGKPKKSSKTNPGHWPDAARPELSDREIAEVNSYLDEQTPYYDVNDHLRKGGKLFGDAQLLQDAILKAKPLAEPITVVRGLQVDDSAELLKQLKKGKFQDAGFMSTSRNKAGSFSGNVQFTISAWHGLDASHYGSNQDEFLLPAGSKFRVTSLQVDGKRIKAHLEQIV